MVGAEPQAEEPSSWLGMERAWRRWAMLGGARYTGGGTGSQPIAPVCHPAMAKPPSPPAPPCPAHRAPDGAGEGRHRSCPQPCTPRAIYSHDLSGIWGRCPAVHPHFLAGLLPQAPPGKELPPSQGFYPIHPLIQRDSVSGAAHGGSQRLFPERDAAKQWRMPAGKGRRRDQVSLC